MKRFCGLLIMGVVALSLLYFQTGCGGGGSSTSREGGPDATLTASNAAQVGDAVTQAVKLVAPATALGEVKAASISPERSAPLISIFEKVVPVVRKQGVNDQQSSAPPRQDCSGGGNIEVTNISVPDLSGNVKADVSVNSCTIGAEVMNGSLKVTVPVSALTDLQHVTEFTIEASSFTYSDPHSSISLADSFTMVAKNITYSGNSLTGGSLTLGGTVSGTIDGSPINIACDSLGFQFSADTSGVTVSVSGRMNASCLGGWVTMGTNQSVFLPANAHCPTKGEIVASSGGSNVTVHIDEASSKIGIFFNGTLVQTYDDCSKVIGLCVKP